MGGRTLDQFNSRQQARAKSGKTVKDATANSQQSEKEKSRTQLQSK
jgi:hypothetical protein